ncbi:MAG: ATP-binding protein, partial [Bdellovibrionales bacterium]
SVQKNESEAQQEDNCLVYGVAETIVAEKRVLLPGSSLHIELNVDDSVYMSWINMPAEAIGRILSNLLNNSIEAFESDRSISNPRISVAISSFDASTLRISVQDNAGGIPNHVINCIRAGEKLTTKKTGSGIGLTQARECLARYGGRLNLYSQLGFGSVVNCFVCVAEAPSWVVSELEIDRTKPLLILDDDDSIHSIWRSRLGSVVELINCNDIHTARFHVRTLPSGSTLFVDYLLRGSPETGLDFIATLPKKLQACLVTSRFDEPNIQKQAMELKCKILPKYLAPFAPLRVKVPAEGPQMDFILIDDDFLVRKVWQMEADRLHLLIRTFSSYAEFLNVGSFSRDTPIYVDRLLGSENGIEVANKLWTSGYLHIFLTTGQTRQGEHYPFLAGIVGKDFPARTS